MIVYLDTSSVIPLLVDEPGSPMCIRLWNEATRVVSVRLLYAEARAALAQAHRMARISLRQLTTAVVQLDVLVGEMGFVEVTDALVRSAGSLAQAHWLKGYDAVHLAAAHMLSDDDTVLVSGDRQLIGAAAREGLATALTQ
ncbi:MAG: type II toxin-antitoxin system VapC family toxin [Acidimicrobiaceae bacterium]|nr:type II toxin-antitoxin system VapC family toxin [Acidimicrobiaceae bacterium]